MADKKPNSVKKFMVGLLKKQTKTQQKKERASLKPFIIELIIFTVLVVGYFLLVVALLPGRLKALFEQNKPLYAVVALGLIATQGVVLEIISAALLKLVQAKMK